MAEVTFTDEALEDLRDLDGAARRQVLRKLKELETEPEKRGAPLGNRRRTGNLTNFRKLVIGDRQYRAIYQVKETGDVVVVWVVKDRADDQCYELAVSRLALHADPTVAQLGTTLLDTAFQRKR